jgi:hypothetical protein
MHTNFTILLGYRLATGVVNRRKVAKRYGERPYVEWC